MSGGSGGDAYLDDREREVEEHDAQRQQVRLVAAVRGSQRGSGGAHHAMLRAPRCHDDRLAACPGEGGVFLEVDALRARGVRRGGGTHRLRQEGELLCAGMEAREGRAAYIHTQGKGSKKKFKFYLLGGRRTRRVCGRVPRATWYIPHGVSHLRMPWPICPWALRRRSSSDTGRVVRRFEKTSFVLLK